MRALLGLAIAACVAFALSSPAHSKPGDQTGRWIELLNDPAGNVWYVDAPSTGKVFRNPTAQLNTKFWVKIAQKDGTRSLVLQTINCSDRSFRFYAIVNYDANNDYKILPGPAGVRYATPGTTGGDLADFICGELS